MSMTPAVQMGMEQYYCGNPINSLWEEIGTLHMSYLGMEDSPEKILRRNELEDAIGHFLSLAPHSRKFMFPEIPNVLYRSASNKKEFSGYRAALGWNAIAMYAANLWNQPWRKEYKEIKSYSGFYKHQIEANLVGAETIFELMGYKNDEGGILMLDGPICPDQVVSVSQDALVAYVECQVLKSVWEEVSSSFKITWLEVLEFRQSHVCSPKHCIQALKYLCHERQLQQHAKNHLQGTDIRHCNASATYPSNRLFPPLYSHMHPTSPLPCMCNNDHYPNNYPIYSTSQPHNFPYHNYTSIIYSQPLAKPVYNHSCHHPNGYLAPVPVSSHVCPTAQLIEVECQPGNESCKSSATNDGETWDYVYKELEHQGYSKDLGEKGDILNAPLDKKLKVPIKEAKKINPNDLDKMLDCLNLIDKKKTSAGVGSTSLSENGYAKNTSKVIPCTTEVYSNKTNDSKANFRRVHTPPSKSNGQMDDVSTKSQLNVTKWQCTACTYINDQERSICEMCDKSKIAVNDAMEIGGSQCSTCTLVNPRDNKNCSACSSNLEGSPTYI